MSGPRFDLCVVLYRAPSETRAFLDSLLDLAPSPRFQLHVLDNSPDDEAWNVLADHAGALREAGIPVRADRDPSNPGFPRGISRAAAWGDAEFIGVLNPDVVFTDPSTLAKIATMFDDDKSVAIQGPRQTDSPGHLIHSGWVWERDGRGQAQRHAVYGPGEYRDIRDVEMITGSALFCRRHVWDELADCPGYRAACPEAEGPLGDFQHFFDDSLLCAHAFAHGHRLVYRGDIDMVHECSRSAASDSPYIQRAWATSRPRWEQLMAAMGLSTSRGPDALS